MVKMGIFNSLAIFLQPLCILWWSTIFLCTSELYSLVLLYCDGWFVFPHI